MLNRTLILTSSSGDLRVPVSITTPKRSETDWRCLYEIGWPEEPRHGFGHGIDSTQAMLLALQAIGTDIYTSEYHRSGRLRWEKPGDGYGFPVPKAIRDLLIGQDAVEFG